MMEDGGGTVDYLTAPGAAMTVEEREWIRAQSAAVAEAFGEGQGDPAPTGDVVMVHLGVGPGASLVCSRAGAPEARIVGVDALAPRVEQAEAAGFEALLGDSRLVHVGFEGPVHFLFVDASHDEGSVLADMTGWLPKIPEGGVAGFHDYGNEHLRWCRGVRAAVDAWDWSGWEELPRAGSVRGFRRIGQGQQSCTGDPAPTGGR